MGFDLGSFGGSLLGAGSSLVGGMINATTSKSIAREQMAMQREFAQNGIQWRVEDAKKAGLHPLYAIGASGASYMPVSQDSSAMGNAVADAGAYLGKAIDGSVDKATRRALEQENLEYARQQRELASMKSGAEIMNLELQNRRLVLDNEYQQMLNSQKASGVSGNPARPVSVSTPMGEFGVNNPSRRSHLSKVGGNSASALVGVNLKPSDVVMSARGRPEITAGANSDSSLIRTGDGYAIIPSEQFANSTDDDIISKIAWHMRNTVGNRIDLPPDLDTRSYPLPSWAPKDSVWRYNRFVGEYRPYSRGFWYSRHSKNPYFW